MNSTRMPRFTYQEPSSKDKPPQGFKRLSPDSLQIKSGGGVVSLFGLPFLAAGIFLILAATQIIPFDNADDVPGWAYPMIGLMAIAFTGVGGWLVFGRTWTVVNRATGTIEKIKGLLVPMKRETESLRPYNRVVMLLDEGDSDSPDRYPVLLRGAGKQQSIVEAPDYPTAYTQATCLAEFLNLPLEDATTPNTRRLAASELAATLAERAKTEEASQRWKTRPDKPFHMQSRIEQANGELMVTVPHPKFRLWRYLPNFIPLVVVLYVFFDAKEFFDGSKTPDGVQWAIFAFVGFFFVLLPLLGVVSGALRAKFGYTRLTLSSHKLKLSRRSILSVKSEFIDLSDVIDIDYATAEKRRGATLDAARTSAAGHTSELPMSPDTERAVYRVVKWAAKYLPSKGIIIKSRKGLHYFAAGLPDKEVAYLHSMIKDWIARRA